MLQGFEGMNCSKISGYEGMACFVLEKWQGEKIDYGFCINENEFVFF